MVSSMARGRILLYLLFIAIVPSTSLPECPDQDVITFVSQPRDIESVCRADDVASFPCQAGTSVQPQWMINGTRHSSVTVHQLPDHKYSDHVLTVTNLRSKNGSLYQCLLISSSEGCAYISSEAQLICKDIEVQCSPHYHYEKPRLNNLAEINTTITQGDNSERIYNVTYMDSDSGNRCDSVNLTCMEGVCHHMFNSSLSHCPKTSNITVNVSTISGLDYSLPNPIKIDAINNFVRINITRTSFSCIFLDQSEESEKSCAIKYGPVTPECKNLTSYSESTSDSNNIEIPFDNSTVTIYDGNICFVVIAGNGTKTITVEGIHYNSAYDGTIHQVSQVMVVAILTLLLLLV